LVGLPKLANIKAGIYGKLQGEAELNGELNASADFTQKTMEGLITANASALIKGSAGITAEGEIMTKKVSKKIPLIERNLVRFTYQKSMGLNVSKDGKDWTPRLQDYEALITKEDYDMLNPKSEDSNSFDQHLLNVGLANSMEGYQGSLEQAQNVGMQGMIKGQSLGDKVKEKGKSFFPNFFDKKKDDKGGDHKML